MSSLNEECKKLSREYILRYIAIELEQKKLREDLKNLKSEYEEQGLQTSYVVKAYKMLRAERKLSSKLDDLLAYKGFIETTEEISDKIAELESK